MSSLFHRPMQSRARFSLITAAVMSLATTTTSAWAQPAEQVYEKGRILVMPRAGMSEAGLSKVLRDNGAVQGRKVGRSELRIVDVPSGAEKAVVERLARNPHIKFAELDRVLPPNFASNDPYIGSQWHLTKIGASAAWDGATGSSVTIAILDTGVDSTHTDLAPRLVPGWNVYDGNSNTTDVYGHGTKVAGAAAAALNNAIGVAGVAGNARIMPVRISSPTGSATLSAMVSGLTWAADNGARVANISYLCADSSAVLSAANYFKSKGGLVTSSAGNYSVEEAIPEVTAMIPVSSTDSNDIKATSSSFGSYVSLSAPGVGIYTTTNGGGYASVSGTSFSSPVTAGTIALIMSANPKLSSAEVERVLTSTAVDLGTAGRDKLYGYGRVNAEAAVRMALGTVSTVDQSAPTAAISAPLGSSTVSGLVPVNVSASDNVGVTKVELRVNGVLVATDTSSPFAFSWDSARAVNGVVNLVATAFDAAGNTANSPVVEVNVANIAVIDTTPPTVNISNPVAGASIAGNIAVKVSASDDSGTGGIQQTLLINGKRVATATGGTLSYNWNTRKVSSGTHTVTAIAKDAAGNSTTQSVVVSK